MGGPVYGTSGGGGLRRALEYPSHVLGHFNKVRKFKPDLLSGYGVYESHSAQLLRKPSIGWNDTEFAPGQNRLIRALATNVCVPSSFRGEVFGPKQIRFDGYLELSYLHPNRYRPDENILNLLGVKPNERYAIVRLNAFDATHDVGNEGKGITNAARIELVERLSRHGRVFISPEADLPAELEKYVIKIPAHRIHDALAFASLYVGDGGTMQNEAAILGTPSVRFVVNPENHDLGNGKELEQRYGLLHNFHTIEEVLEKAEELFADPGSKAALVDRRARMLKDQVDVAALMAWFLTNFPESATRLRGERQEVQRMFRYEGGN